MMGPRGADTLMLSMTGPAKLHRPQARPDYPRSRCLTMSASRSSLVVLRSFSERTTSMRRISDLRLPSLRATVPVAEYS